MQGKLDRTKKREEDSHAEYEFMEKDVVNKASEIFELKKEAQS